MLSFNLIDEPWIPCLTRAEVVELSLREVLHRAADVEDINDPSPLVTASLYRLLLAVLHRVFGPTRNSEWGRLHSEGWGTATLDRYLDSWGHRFDLFDRDRPFYQNPTIEGDVAPIRKLTHELGPANAEHFSHVSDATLLTLTSAQAARYLLAYQNFSPGGLVSLQKGEDPKTMKSARAAPLASSAVAVSKGRSLQETLLLNMVRYDPQRGLPFPSVGTDLPAWEQQTAAEARERHPSGYLDWLTWQSRRIRLFAADRDGSRVVDGVLIMKGNQLPPDTLEHDYEQMVAYRYNAKAKPPQSPWPPVGFQRDRAIWRDSLVLFYPVEGDRPRTLGAMADRIEDGEIDDRDRLLDLYGINLDRFNALFWRHERLPLADAYLVDRALRDRLRTALTLAEDGNRSLGRAARLLAELLLSPRSDEGGRKPDPAAVTALVSEMAPGRRYWARLEAHFSRYLIDQAHERITAMSGEAVYGKEALRVWAEHIRRAARTGFDEIAAGLGPDGWSMKAVVRAEPVLLGGLRKARQEAAIGEERVA